MVLVDYCWVWMSRTWTGLRVQRLHQIPSAILNAIPMEIVNSVVAIVSTKYVDASIMYDSSMTISRRWRLCIPIRWQLTPRVCLEIKAVKVITSVRTIVPTKNVEVVLKSDWCMKRSWTRWVYLVARRGFDLMPCIGLFEKMQISPTNNVLAVEELRIKSGSWVVGGLVTATANHLCLCYVNLEYIC